ncbi:hypothetical protein O3597_13935 [Verrucosispora sp. WMMA2044]|uniref:Uncharacterized protein n=1 Tax=Verrucosispora sioxanthis TaxID=2499994 RepID=A0A6M1LDD0_9ACTN|nr:MULTISPECIES: hypothetical protein [Micromonospora]NEE67225.1 hypothetical protein [Verrucosispora sioxanthis]NGM16335.1 hypothetical protein [Verrucosispora sioxanthis]WBB51497.1 hypothetical protein O3597_13935 [Verrucosispora sp. WMMA2044]
MSGQQKALLAALGVLLVVLFAVAVGAGRDDRGDPTARHPLVDLLGRAGGGRGTVDPASVDADCLAATGQFVVDGRCELRVADPGGLRTLVLRGPQAFSVRATAPGDAEFTVTDEVEPAADGSGAVARVAVDRATTVLVSCPAGCLVTIARD